MRLPILWAGLALAVSVQVAPAQRTRDPLAGLDAYIEQVRTSFGIAGLAVGIIRNDSLIYARGFGAKEAGKPGAVTPKTVFAIGSNTKSFTATAAAILVDDGVMRWDDKVTRWLPFFELFDPYVTREITIRDVLSHRSGLGRRGDALWYGTNYTRREILERIRYLEPNAGFRTEMGYQNVMVMAGGEAVGAAAGMSYDDVIRRRIFAPLGMTSSNMSVTELGSLPDVATPHSLEGEAARPIPWRNIDNIGPAGSINSNIEDMARYVRMQLGDGTFEGKKLVSAGNLGVTKTPHINAGGVGDSLTHFVSYGLGWVLQDYRGRKIAWHNGGIDGMLSEMWTVPEERLGVVVLTNTSPHSAGPAIVTNIIDRFLVGAPATDYLARALAQRKAAATSAEMREKRLQEGRLSGTKPSLPLDDYVGKYTSRLYGDVQVERDGEGLALRWQSFRGALEHWHLDQFRGDITPGSRAMLAFRVNQAGKATEVEITDLGRFTRAP